MSILVLTFRGSYLELFVWIACLLVLLATAFFAGWMLRDFRDDS